jgi:uncharacterized membrane protein
MPLFKAFVASLLFFLVVDSIWINLVVLKIYEADIGPMLRDPVSVPAAVFFYLGYVAGVTLLAVLPALRHRTSVTALFNGAILGAVAYGTYTVTNYAVLDGWTLRLVVSDLAWGTALTAATAWAGYLAANTGSSRTN